MSRFKTILFISFLVIILDQLTKWLVRSSVPIFGRINLLPFLDITHLRNKGAAFGILKDLPENYRMLLFIFVLVVAVIVIIIFLIKVENKDKLITYSLSLIMGGALGNSIDRFRLGYVTDFIDFHWFGNPDYHWPPFNIADSAITIGVILILVDTFIFRRGKI